jgi:hypothetical protein
VAGRRDYTSMIIHAGISTAAAGISVLSGHS